MARWLASQPPPAAKGQTRAPYKPGKAPPLREAQAQINAHAKQLARGGSKLKPATPIVTEHTRGQAHGGAASYGTAQARAGLPQDQAVAPHPGLNPRDVKDLGAISSRSVPLLQQALGNLIQDAMYAGPGLYHTAAAPVSDIRHGQFTLPRTQQVAKDIGVSTYETARHPLRRPGDAALLAFALASAGAGAAAKAGTVGRALSAGDVAGAAKAAISRPAPGEINLPGGVQALEHDNPLLRPVQRARLARVSRKVKEGTGGQSVIGREIRAREQVQADVAHAPIGALRHMMRRLTPEEHTAMRIVATEGRHALKNPEETVARQAATHDRFAAEAQARLEQLVSDPNAKSAAVQRAREEIVLNQEVAADIRAALPALKAKRPEFLRATAQARRVSNKSAGELYGATKFTAEGGQTRLAKIAAEYGNPHGVAGEPPPGAFYFPTGDRFKFPAGPAKGQTRIAGARRASPHGIPPVTPSRYLGGTLQTFTGKGLRRGVVTRAGEAISTRASGTAKLASAERIQQHLVSLGTPERISDKQVLIRKGPITESIRREVAAALEEAQTGNQTALVRAQNRIRDALHPAAGEPGVYVDPRFIKQLPAASGSWIARGGAAFNLPFRFTGVYAQPKYLILNRPQNLIMRKMMQAGLPHVELKGRVASMRTQLGDNVTAVLDGMTGESRTQSYMPQSRVRGFERGVTEKIMEATDRDERFLSVLARAAQKGYTSEQDLRRLASSNAPESVVNDRVAIARRARKDLVDFAVTPPERELSDFIYFYPWLSRGSVWSARWLLNRPGQAAFASQVAQIGHAQQLKDIGPVPKWLEPYVATAFGLSNTAPLFTPTTPAEIATTLTDRSAGQAHSFAQDFGTPFAQLVGTPTDQLKKQLTGQFGPTSVLTNLGVMGAPSKTFPDRGPATAAERLLVGTVGPRKPDRAEIAKQAAKALPTGPRTKANWEAKLTQLGVTEPDPRITAAINADAARAAARAKRPKTTHGRLQGDLDALVTLGEITPAIRAETMAYANTLSEYSLAQRVAKIHLGKRFDPYGVLSKINDAVAKKKGGG